MCSYSDFENEYEADRTDVSDSLETPDDWFPEVEESGTPEGADELATLFASLGLDDYDEDFANLDSQDIPFDVRADDMLRRAQIGVELAENLIGETVEELNATLADLFNEGGNDDKATAMLAAHMVAVYFGSIVYHLTGKAEYELASLTEDIRSAAAQIS